MSSALILQMNTTSAARTPPKKSRRQVSKQSLLALDWLNFFKADVQTTVGPYLAIFLLAVRHWNTGKIGIAISVPGIVAIIAQTPMGALVDWTVRKRILVMVSVLALGTGALLLIAADSLVIVTLGHHRSRFDGDSSCDCLYQPDWWVGVGSLSGWDVMRLTAMGARSPRQSVRPLSGLGSRRPPFLFRGGHERGSGIDDSRDTDT